MAIENPVASHAAPNGHMNKTQVAVKTDATIIDIRKIKVEQSLVDDIKNGLRPKDGNGKTLPTLLLYSAPGLRLFEKITYLQEYYLTGEEIKVLKKYASHIAERIKDGAIIVELGSGNLRKIEILLNALEKAQKNVEYYALDLSLPELQRTIGAIPTQNFRHVKIFGLHGTYDDGLEWLQSEQNQDRPKSVLSMGSSIGNFTKLEALGFLKSFAATLRPGGSDSLLIGIDACDDPRKVFHAYNDQEGTTHQFILNGLKHANEILGSEEFQVDDWKVIGEYRYDEFGGRHMAFVSPIRDVTIDGVTVRKDERIQIEESNKFSVEEADQLFRDAGLVQAIRWANQQGDYALHMAYKPSFTFPSKPEQYAAAPVPSVADWQNLWTAWDTLTQQMIPKDELLSKPIKLRNACIFYLGHIPTFLDIHLSKATGEIPKELEYFQTIFERGIDPDVDNPELCHAHSEIPDEWPPVEDILVYQDNVRQRVKSLMNSEEVNHNGAVRKALWIGFEHEAMHLETLLYMLVQGERTLPPPEMVQPDFEALAAESEARRVPVTWTRIPARKVTFGMDDPDEDLHANRYFGWDNEKPRREVDVGAFEVRRPITNGEYAEYLDASGQHNKLPASWNTLTTQHGTANGVSNGANLASFISHNAVRTVFGQVPLQYALDWPVQASYDELAGCANWMGGGRIPTHEEVRSIYEHVEDQKSRDVENVRSERIPAVNSHLLSDGVDETPPSNPSQYRGSSNGVTFDLNPSSLFIDLQSANVGFKAWHPTPITGDDKVAGQGELGGVWEWTSSMLEEHEGFEPMKLYPGYTADFFDRKHNIVLGGSWATLPRIAGRKSFVNWYQRNYPFVWAGTRLVRDI